MEQADNKFPRQTRYIIGNEACERFSFYGMKSMLAIYMTQQLMFSDDDATTYVHYFLAAIYFLPLLGGWIADRLWGRYNTILWISLFYCLGHGILAFLDVAGDIETRKWILFSGMALIAIGAGGIKPCVSSFMGDQFSEKQRHLLPKAYAAFYWSINLGSFTSFIVIPELQKYQGWSWAFGVPGIAMAIATFVFWCGRKKYVRIPPQGKQKRDSLVSIWLHCFLALFKKGSKSLGGFWQPAQGNYDPERVQNAIVVVRILKIFALVVPFWMLFDQTGSSWLLQGETMKTFKLLEFNLPEFLVDQSTNPEGIFSWEVKASQLQAANPVFVMILIPFLTLFVYPRIKWLSNPLRRISAGIMLSGVAFGIVAALQLTMDNGNMLSLAWQLLPYLVLTLAEVLVSTTGLEYAFTQAPASMKSTVTSFWNVTIAAGNLIVAGITTLMKKEEIVEAVADGAAAVKTASAEAVTFERFLFYGVFAFLWGFVFIVLVKKIMAKEKA